jgi:DNA-binding NtrC family response regulator
MAQTVVSQLPVLLVDDEPQILRSVSLSLRASGIGQVITLEDIRGVLPLLSEQDVGVVVLDLTMPYLSGQTLLEHLTADYPDIPVIVMTATNDLDTAVQCMKAGAIDYLVKPVETNPGNVREPEAMLFDAVARHQGGPLSLQSFKAAIAEGPPASHDGIESTTLISLFTLFLDRLPTLGEAREVLIAEALRRAEGNQGLAAGMLGLSRQALNKRLERRK